MDILAYRIHILHIFLDGVGVVETKITCATKLFGNTKIHTDGLGMAYVQVAIGLGWEACVQASAVLAGL